MKIKNKRLFTLYIFAILLLILLIVVNGYLKLIVFIILYCVANFISAVNEGWRMVSELYKLKHSEFYIFEKPIYGWTYFGKGDIGNGISTFIGDKGILLKAFLLFRIGRPPIFIPWDEMSSIYFQRTSVPASSINFIRKHFDKLSDKIFTNIKLKKLPDFVLIVPWKKMYVDHVPKSIQLKYEEGIDLKKG